MAVLGFFNSIRACRGPAAVHMELATAATVLAAKAQKASGHRFNGGNRLAVPEMAWGQL